MTAAARTTVRVPHRPALAVFLAVVALAPLAFPTRYYLSVMVFAGIHVLLAVGLNLVMGYTGQVSLGHAGFYGLGAYASAVLTAKYGVNPWAGMAAALALAVVVALAIGIPSLHLEGYYLGMATLGFGIILHILFVELAWLTGGAEGLTGMSMDPLLGLFEFDLWGRTAYFYSLAVLFLMVMAARRLVRSPFGLSLRAIKGNPLRASAIGIRPDRRLVAVYTVASVYAGLAGALLAQTTQFVSLDVLAFHRSADGLLVLVLGGSGYLYGGLIGAVAFKLMHDWISALTPQYWLFWIGLFLVAIVMLGRDRLLRGPRDLMAWAITGFRRGVG